MNIDQRRSEVIGLLRGDREKPLPNENELWGQFRLQAGAYVAERHLQIKGSTIDPTERSQRYADLTKALRAARELVEEVLRDPVMVDGLVAAWPFRSASEALLSNPQAEMVGAVGAIARLEQSSAAAEKRVHRKRGRPTGSGNLDCLTVGGLMHIYQGATGRRAGAGRGPFFRLVKVFLSVVGLNMSDEAILSVIKKTLALRGKQQSAATA